MLGTPMPKTAIDKHCGSAPTVSQIRFAKNVGWISLDSSKVIERELIQKRTLELGILRFDGRHRLRPLLLRPIVHGKVD
jgi:hypothetical protein